MKLYASCSPRLATLITGSIFFSLHSLLLYFGLSDARSRFCCWRNKNLSFAVWKYWRKKAKESSTLCFHWKAASTFDVIMQINKQHKQQQHNNNIVRRFTSNYKKTRTTTKMHFKAVQECKRYNAFVCTNDKYPV